MVGVRAITSACYKIKYLTAVQDKLTLNPNNGAAVDEFAEVV